MLLRHAPLLVALACVCFGGNGCGCNGKIYKRPYPTPGVKDLLNHTQEISSTAQSFRAESVMDYWVGEERVRGTVLVMGRLGARMRFNALSPTGGNVAGDLACNGVDFKYIDYNSNCQMTGPCTRDSIAKLLRVVLEPDDFLVLAVGGTPLIEGAEGTVTWDKKHGYEIVQLVSGDNQQTQRLILDGREGHWDVLESTVRDARGNIEWRLKNREFVTIKDKRGASFRVPSKTRFEQPGEKADLIVKWKKRELNLEIEDDKFEIEIPSGIPPCK